MCPFCFYLHFLSFNWQFLGLVQRYLDFSFFLKKRFYFAFIKGATIHIWKKTFFWAYKVAPKTFKGVSSIGTSSDSNKHILPIDRPLTLYVDTMLRVWRCYICVSDKGWFTWRKTIWIIFCCSKFWYIYLWQDWQHIIFNWGIHR